MSPVYGNVHVVQSSMWNWDGNHYLVVVSVDPFCKYIRLRVISCLLILKRNSLDSAEHCTGKVIVTPFMN